MPVTASLTFRVSCLIAVLSMTSACLPVVAAGAGSVGVSAAQERTVGNAIDDVTVEAKVTNKFLQSTNRELTTGISAKSTEGVVVLTGKTQQQETAIEAVRLTWEVAGVREVINEIQILDQNRTTFPRDAWITTQVKTRLIAEKYIKSVNYNIETVNSAVYVMGIAQDQAELDRALNVISRVGGVTQVISHVRLKDDPRRAVPAPQPVDNSRAY